MKVELSELTCEIHYILYSSVLLGLLLGILDHMVLF